MSSFKYPIYFMILDTCIMLLAFAALAMGGADLLLLSLYAGLLLVACLALTGVE